MPYQQITIGGLVLHRRGRDRSGDYGAIFPDGARDRRILDLGCNDGYFSLRAAYEGAAAVVGVDSSQKCVEKARQFAKRLGVEVTFHHGNIEDGWPDDAAPDTVLCIYVLHHLKDIDRIRAVLKRITATPEWNDLWLGLLNPLDTTVEFGAMSPKGHVGMHPRFFERLWPEWTITAQPAPWRPEQRTLLHVQR